MKWIKLEDRLPETYEFVLVFATTKGTNEPQPITLARLLLGGTLWEFLEENDDGSGSGVYQDLYWHVEMEDITQKK